MGQRLSSFLPSALFPSSSSSSSSPNTLPSTIPSTPFTLHLRLLHDYSEHNYTLTLPLSSFLLLTPTQLALELSTRKLLGTLQPNDIFAFHTINLLGVLSEPIRPKLGSQLAKASHPTNSTEDEATVAAFLNSSRFTTHNMLYVDSRVSRIFEYIPESVKSNIGGMTPSLLMKLESIAMKKITSEEQEVLQEETDIDANDLDFND